MSLLDPLSRYKTIAEAVAFSMFLAWAVYEAHAFLDRQQQLGYDRAVSEYSAKLEEQKIAAARETADLRTRLETAQNDSRKREENLRGLAAAAGASSSGLRDALANIRSSVPTDTIDALRNTTAALATVFGDCQDKYRGLAEAAGRHANDVQTLTASWPTVTQGK